MSLSQTHDQIIESAKANIKAAETKMKHDYDERNKTHQPPDFDGKRVWWKNVVSNQTSKLRDKALGPFVAEKSPDNPLVYRIVGHNGVFKDGIHVDHLKECYLENIPLGVLRNRGRPRREPPP